MDSSSHSSILDNSSHSISRLQQFIKFSGGKFIFETLLIFEVRLTLEVLFAIPRHQILLDSSEAVPGNIPDFINQCWINPTPPDVKLLRPE